MTVIKTWSAKHEECKNCNTTRYPQIAKGFCKRCYPLFLKLQRLQKWDLSNPKSLKDIPPSLRPFIKTQGHLDGFKLDAKKQIESRLNYLRMREEKLKSVIKGIDVEHELQKIARRIVPSGDKLYHGIASLIDHDFSVKQKKVIYILLNEIDEALPWKGIRYGQHAGAELARAFVRSFTQ